jgi:hypothetical protein
MRTGKGEPEPPPPPPTNQPVMTKLTQAQMRRLCVSENIVHAAAAWKAAMLHQQTPALPLVCVEEDADPDSGCRTLAISVPHPKVRGRRINTYAISVHQREMETYRTFMSCVNACKVRSQRFRKDGLGIWLTTPREDKAMGKMFTIILKTSDNWNRPEQVKQGLRGVDPDYLGPNLFFSRERAAVAAAQGFSSGWRIIQVKDLEANLAA